MTRCCRACGEEFAHGGLNWRLWRHALLMPWVCSAWVPFEWTLFGWGAERWCDWRFGFSWPFVAWESGEVFIGPWRFWRRGA